MSDSLDRYLHGQLTESQRRYAYFLLAAAASGIALSVNQTEGEALGLSQLPLGAAVACWGLSFVFGCRHLSYMAATMRANAEMFVITEGRHPDVPRHPDYIEAAASGARSAANENAEGANRNAKR